MSLTDDINAISDRVLQLEQENEQLKQAPGNTEAYDKLMTCWNQIFWVVGEKPSRENQPEDEGLL